MLGSQCLGQYLAPDVNSGELSPILDGELPPHLKAFAVSAECMEPWSATWWLSPTDIVAVFVWERAQGSSLCPEHWQWHFDVR